MKPYLFWWGGAVLIAAAFYAGFDTEIYRGTTASLERQLKAGRSPQAALYLETEAYRDKCAESTINTVVCVITRGTESAFSDFRKKHNIKGTLI